MENVQKIEIEAFKYLIEKDVFYYFANSENKCFDYVIKFFVVLDKEDITNELFDKYKNKIGDKKIKMQILLKR